RSASPSGGAYLLRRGSSRSPRCWRRGSPGGCSGGATGACGSGPARRRSSASDPPRLPAGGQELAGERLPEERQPAVPVLDADPAQPVRVGAGAVPARVGGEGRAIARGEGGGARRLVAPPVR